MWFYTIAFLICLAYFELPHFLAVRGWMPKPLLDLVTLLKLIFPLGYLFILRSLASRRVSELLRMKALWILVICLLGIALSTFYMGALPSNLEFLAQAIGFVVLFLLVLDGIDSLPRFRRILEFLFGMGLIAALGVLLLFPFENLARPSGELGMVLGWRLTFGALNPNTYAYRLVPLIVVGLYLFQTTESRLSRAVYLSGMGIFVLQIALSWSRGAMVSLLVAVAMAAGSRAYGVGRFVAAGALLGLLAAPASHVLYRLSSLSNALSFMWGRETDFSVQVRILASQVAWQRFLYSPLLGIGGNKVNALFFEPGISGIHNGFLQVLAETGLVTFIPLTAFLLLTYRDLWFAIARLREDQEAQPSQRLLGISLWIILAIWLIAVNLAPFDYAFWILIGLVWAFLRITRQGV